MYELNTFNIKTRKKLGRVRKVGFGWVGDTYPPNAHTPVVKLVLRLAEETLQAGHRTTS